MDSISFRTIDLNELRRHNTEKDCWIAVRGKVYDVTNYMRKHPGGVREIIKGVGKDATEIFERAHFYVNPDRISGVKAVGFLSPEMSQPGGKDNLKVTTGGRKSSPAKPTNPKKETKGAAKPDVKRKSTEVPKNQIHPKPGETTGRKKSGTSEKSKSSASTNSAKLSQSTHSSKSTQSSQPRPPSLPPPDNKGKRKSTTSTKGGKKPVNREVHTYQSEISQTNKPRPSVGDEKHNFVTRVFKGVSYSLPHTEFEENDTHIIYKVKVKRKKNFDLKDNWSVGVIEKRKLIIKYILDSGPNIWYFHVKLLHKLEDDNLNIVFEKNYSSMILSLKKPKPKLNWGGIGSALEHNNEIIDIRQTISDMYNVAVLYKEKLTHDTYYFAMRINPNAIIGVPIGYHLKFQIDEINRSYTPVWPEFFRHETQTVSIRTRGQILHFIIKIYPQGPLSSKLSQIPVLSKNSHLKIGKCTGNFNRDFLKSAKRVVLIAAGTGITAIAAMLKYYMEKIIDKHREPSHHVSIVLGYFNKAEADIILNKKWKEMAQKHRFFNFVPVLSRPETNWKGLKGRISTNTLQAIFTYLPNKPKDAKQDHGIRFVICGPDGFNKSALEAIKKFEYQSDLIYVFGGI